MLRLVQQGQGYQPVCSEQVKRDIARIATVLRQRELKGDKQ